MNLNNHGLSRISAVCIFVFFSHCSFAQSGAFEINQACVQDGCFSGDSPGFPVTLQEPGTYLLTSDLQVDDPTVTAIVFRADNVSLDLNRFTVSGPVQCTGEPASCDQDGPAVGVDGGFHENLRIANGTISGFSQWGLVTGPNSYVERILSRSNFRTGIVARKGTHIIRSKAIQNQGSGFVLRADTIATEVIASGNEVGIQANCIDDVGCNQIIDSNISRNNRGINDWGGAFVRGSTIAFNFGAGVIVINGSSTYEGNHIIFNGGEGIAIGSGTFFSDPPPRVVLRNNRISENSPDITTQVANSLLDAGGNVCGNEIGC